LEHPLELAEKDTVEPNDALVLAGEMAALVQLPPKVTVLEPIASPSAV